MPTRIQSGERAAPRETEGPEAAQQHWHSAIGAIARLSELIPCMGRAGSVETGAEVVAVWPHDDR